MKFYSVHNSPNGRRVAATIAHLGVDVETIEISFPKGEHKAPDYLALNPNGKVPTLVDGDLHLWESRAMMQYVASKKPGNQLWPSDPAGQANIARWMFWDATELARATTPLAFERVVKPFLMKQEPDAVVCAAAERQFHVAAPVLNAQLEKHKFVAGDHLTLADFSVGGCLSFAEVAKVPWGDYKHILTWWGRLNEVPAWKSTAPKLG